MTGGPVIGDGMPLQTTLIFTLPRSERNRSVETVTRPWAPGSDAAPIDRIPVELLSIIMILAVPQFDFASPDWDFLPKLERSMSDILDLTAVSRRWRQVAENTPQLWSCLHVRAHESKIEEYFMKTWMSRSRAVPLSVSFDGDTEEPDSECFNLLRGNLHRCKHLQLDAPAHMISSLMSGSFPHLETVRLLNRYKEQTLALKDLSLSSAAPGIRLVYLQGISSDFNTKSFNWWCVTELILEATGLALMPSMTVIAECTNLHILRLTFNKLTEEDAKPYFDDNDGPRPRCEKLHTLEVKAPDSYLDFSVFIWWLFLPALRRLKLYGCFVLYPCLLEMIPRDGCLLEELVIDHDAPDPFTTEEEHLLTFFKSLPDLRTLEIIGGIPDAFRTDIAKRLTFKPGRPRNDYLLPKVESMKIWGLGGWASYWDIQKMLESRSKIGAEAPATRLKCATITSRGYSQKHRWDLKADGHIIHDGWHIQYGFLPFVPTCEPRSPGDEDEVVHSTLAVTPSPPPEIDADLLD
ncbi:hypothetical protein GLOTRDRAFT_96683 [Gloeophyllum trabeum ATCC 11539]|uniref:Uncharacterized protein n=1 Tax=Gloeophyllum trabeum (strain ATCC 11539 / FP-39264 / Madison 617) TaxID=670483 RepID=S7RA60_GLOTA|nr:uncharacterized protein GLOTRDRAFT_96683 [Gloeophyllum trabeum ATCC 11539]EPQ51150.1 hypothetical protein GLOTRDRAFT_96683 [Gloeophyllum trabeum ATCC 11539]